MTHLLRYIYAGKYIVSNNVINDKLPPKSLDLGGFSMSHGYLEFEPYF